MAEADCRYRLSGFANSFAKACRPSLGKLIARGSSGGMEHGADTRPESMRGQTNLAGVLSRVGMVPETRT